jgi:hypothetical protein
MRVPRVSIIILNWNGWRDTIECLESLYRITYPNYDVIVIDNGSQDESIQKIREYAKGKIKVISKFFEYNPNNKPIKVFEISEKEAKRGKLNRPLYEKFDPDRRMILIKNDANHGFAGGNNIGIKFALSALNPKYVLLLNNDTVVERKFLDKLVKIAESDDKIGIVGPKIYYYLYGGKSDIIQYMGAQINLWTLSKHVYGHKQQDHPSKSLVDTQEVHGACILIKRRVFQEIRFLNENYFAYWEETDFCFKAKKSGFKLLVIPSSKIWHKAGSGNPKEKRINPLATYFFGRNVIYFVRTNLSGCKRLFGLLYLMTLKFLFLNGVYLLYYRNLHAVYTFNLGIINGIENKMGKPSFLK